MSFPPHPSTQIYAGKREVDVDYIECPEQIGIPVPPQMVKQIEKMTQKHRDEYIPRSIVPPENPIENEKIKKILQQAFESTRSRNYSMLEKNPDPFAPTIVRGEYYHWRDQAGQDYWRTDLFNKNGLREQYIQNPDGVGRLETLQPKCLTLSFWAVQNQWRFLYLQMNGNMDGSR